MTHPEEQPGESERQHRPRFAKRWRRPARWAVTIVVVGLVGYFFARALADNWASVQETDLAFSWWWFLAVALFALAVPVTGLNWAQLVRVLDRDAELSTREAVAVQSASWLLKYVPGQVGSVANKVIWAGRKGISRTLVVITFVYENVFLQLASIVPSSVILLVALGPQLFGHNATLLLAPLLVLVPAALVLWPRAFRVIVGLPANRVLKRPVPPEYFLSSVQSLRAFIVFLGPRLINGAGFVLIAWTVSGIGPEDWLTFAAAYVFAGAVGILAILVPSGLGVREAVVVLILSQSVPIAEAILISLLARLLSTAADAVIALIYVAVRRTIPKEIRP